MTRTLNYGVVWVLGLFLCLALAAQTPPPAANGNTNAVSTVNTNVNTNAVTNEVVQAQTQETNEPVTNAPAYSIVTNQIAAQTNLNYLLGFTPNQPPLIGPGAVGNPQIQNALAGKAILNVPPGAAAAAAPTGPAIPLWGPIDMRANMNYLFTAADNVESQPGVGQSTVQQTVSLGLIFDIGSHWILDYMPSYSIYSGGGFQNTFSQNLLLRGGTTYEDWTLGLVQSYSSTFEPLIETGTQTSEVDYQTAITAAYQMGSKLSLQLAASQYIQNTGGFDNVDTWSGNVGLAYAASDRLSYALSLGVGYDDVSGSSSSPFEILQGSITFRPGPKLSVNVSGGAEDLQFIDPSAPSLITPIFSAAAYYRLLPSTTLSLTGSRTVTPSFFGNQVLVSTTVGGSIQQVLSKKWALSLNAGYTSEPETQIIPGVAPQFFLGVRPTTFLAESEKLNSSSLGVTLNYAVLTRLSLAAFWSISDTTSSLAAYKYTSRQVGFSLTYSY